MASFLDKIGLADVLTRIKNAFVAKADTQEVQFLDIDSTPTANSTNLVTSGGVKNYVDNNIPTVPVQDVTVGGTSVVSNNVAAIPAMLPLAGGNMDASANVKFGVGNSSLNLAWNGVTLGNAHFNISELQLEDTVDAGTGGIQIDDSNLYAYYGNKTFNFPNISGTLALTSQIPDVSQFVTKSVNDLTNYYLKSETYTKAEVAALIGAIQQFHYEIVATLPATGEGNVLYLVGPTGSGSDRYEEYVYANNQFTKIGDTSIDLSGYVTTTALNTALAAYTTSSDLATLLAGKQDTINDLADIRSGSQDNVKYTQQTLTDAQKTQARTNIGATAPEIFWAEYGTTTLQEVTNAYNAGKLVICKYQGKFYTLSTLTETYCYFTAVNNTAYYRLLLNGSNWSAAQGSLEVVGNKVTSLSSSSTDTQYPSAKLVYDSLAEKQDVIDANNKLDYSLIDNTPTIPIISTDIILDKTTDEKTASPKAVWDVIEDTALLDDTTTFSYEPVTVATTKNGVISQTITWTNNQYTLSNQVYGSIPQSNIDLFENCGASFNDTGADVTVTDLYGRSFTHKAGCFMMNGLGDLSYQEILTAYNYANISQPYAAANGMPSPRPLESSPARTNFWTFTQNWNTQVSFYMFACYNHVSNLTTVRLKNNDSDVYTGAMRQAFTSASRVEYIYPAIECSSQTGTGSAANSFYGAFDNMANLKEIRLKSLKISLSFKNSPNLSMNSIKYMIDNETSTSAFTITLHATAYNAAIADSGIQTSLSNHPNVTLASA